MSGQVTFQNPDGTTQVHTGRAGDSVMKVAVMNGVDGIVAECGGSMSCATCHVFVKSSTVELPAVSEYEDEMLETTAVERAEDSRLSCQLVLTDGADVVVAVPDEQL